MAEALGVAEEEAVVGLFFEADAATHIVAEGFFATDHDAGDVIEGVGVAFAEFVGPDDEGVVEHGAVAGEFGGFAEAFGEVGEFAGEPLVDFEELGVGVLVGVGVVGEGVMAFFDAEPAHLSHADGAHVLEGSDACHVVGEGVDEEVDLDAADLGGVVVDEFEAGVDVGDAMGEGGLLVGFFEVVFEVADEGHVLIEEGLIAGAEFGGDAFEVGLDVVQDADKAVFVLHASVEFGEHLVGVVYGGDGLIGTGIGHAGPGVGTIGDGDAEFEGAEAGFGAGLGLEEVFYLLVDRDASGPTGWVAAAAADVAGEEFGAGEEAAHAAHVGVAIATDFVEDAIEDEGAFFEGFEGL